MVEAATNFTSRDEKKPKIDFLASRKIKVGFLILILKPFFRFEIGLRPPFWTFQLPPPLTHPPPSAQFRRQAKAARAAQLCRQNGSAQ